MREIITKVIKDTFQITEMPSVVNQDNIDKWDSLGHLHLIMAIEKEFSVKLNMQDYPTMTSIERIQECLLEKMSE